MLGIVGTIPDADIPLIHGPVTLENGRLFVDNHCIAINRGTPALMAAAAKTLEHFNSANVYAFLAGDIGAGKGSRLLYQFLAQHLHTFNLDVLTFHYLQPDVDWHNKVLYAIESMTKRPFLIADAGFMYAAKMSGQANSYDFFTPDIGELAFLADDLAPHPFYTRGFILHKNDKIEELVHNAYHFDNAAQYLLVKGSADYVVQHNRIVTKINKPSYPAMEAIGGTGDTLTGLLAGLCVSGFSPLEAAITAAQANRLVGYYSVPSPATQFAKLIEVIPQALQTALQKRKLEE